MGRKFSILIGNFLHMFAQISLPTDRKQQQQDEKIKIGNVDVILGRFFYGFCINFLSLSDGRKEYKLSLPGQSHTHMWALQHLFSIKISFCRWHKTGGMWKYA